MNRKLTPDQLDEIEAAARSEITARVTAPSIDQVGRVRREWETFLKAATPINVLALIYDLREADATIERVRELHRENAYPDRPVSRCRDCDDVWPCETARALGEEA
ncbi:hypothetical protein I6I76_10025 [Dermacoccus nishinomiyaensis]|uniref:hypothetical protein n=1 Tax=Dermacoccus nishinomiyaensis TaxID=1274 RepID=UPI000E0068B5|nr:hypothetical protein [Dermacoccus nishinomiyaensis]QQY23869.1 hypothetical protein I6I76_10025 [Dermacoccus nishinomiyaensis]STD11972.1 Uncharacterised protein [Dermacoccus nishinomiyaensis]STD12467.1 Uncharacterised protein [Dermacoccus nishinomiyaensis]